MDLSKVSEESGIYCLKIRGGLTKFGVAKNLRNRLGSREYKTSIIDDHKIWHVPESVMFEKETEIRERFKDRLREGFRDYLMGDHFVPVVEFVDGLVSGSKVVPPAIESKNTKLYGLEAVKEVIGIG